MAKSIVSFILIVLLFENIKSETCENPSFNSKVYTTTDGTVVTDVAFIAEFTVSCPSGAKDMTLYADINGKALPVMKSMDNNKYQVSWTDELSKVSAITYPVRIYDDEGFSMLRKAQRNGEDTSNIKPLFLLNISHAGTHLGPWVQSEFVAAVTAVLLWYLAYTAKSKLQA
ncbi:translocon-associated protein subunit delta-like [Centruroides sculpturatus]|uniref:translocon-associated protein subunit delta-like n=1 Tax=Centruroides sculpturatus TaxID=218467 RepID=UPI000C6E77EA|nr:translocon-associated protein subunit delta-like [Centruroides sculpturatus]